MEGNFSFFQGYIGVVLFFLISNSKSVLSSDAVAFPNSDEDKSPVESRYGADS